LDSQSRHHEVAAVRRLFQRDQHPGLCVAGGAQAHADRIQPSSGYAFTGAVRHLAQRGVSGPLHIALSHAGEPSPALKLHLDGMHQRQPI